MQSRFASGWWPDDRWAALASPAVLMHSDANLPHLPPDVLLAEAARWVAADGAAAAVWPGECPFGPDDPVTQHEGFSPEALVVVELIGHGARQSEAGHVDQAMRCWAEAARLLKAPGAIRRIAGSRVGDGDRAEWLDIAEGNIRAVQQQSFGPYSYPAEALARLLLKNVRLDADAAPPRLVLPRAIRLAMPPAEEPVERFVD